MCSSIFSNEVDKWSNMTDFKWKSGNLVSLSCTVIMSNFHYRDRAVIKGEMLEIFFA